MVGFRRRMVVGNNKNEGPLAEPARSIRFGLALRSGMISYRLEASLRRDDRGQRH